MIFFLNLCFFHVVSFSQKINIYSFKNVLIVIIKKVVNINKNKNNRKLTDVVNLQC